MEEVIVRDARVKLVALGNSGADAVSIAPETVSLYPKAPTLENYDKALCPKVYEDIWYNFYFQCSDCPTSNVDTIQVLVNDYEVGYVTFNSHSEVLSGQVVFYNPSHKGHNSFNGQPFLLLFDAVIVTVVINFKDGSHLDLHSGFLLCLSRNKTDSKNVSAMLAELSNFDDYQINKWLFEHGHSSGKSSLIESAFTHASYRSFNSYLQLLEEVMVCYKANFNYFRAMGKHRIEKKGVLVSYQSVKSINAKSFEWLMQNADQLGKVPYGGIEYLGDHYLPLKIHSEVNYKSFDIYENQVIIGFLLTVLNSAQQTATELAESLRSQERKLSQGMVVSTASAPDNYAVPELSGQSEYVDYYRNTLLSRLEETIKSLVNLYRQYNSLFEVSARNLLALPRKTKPFQEVKPYTLVFALIIKWFEYGDFNLEQEKLLLQTKTLDKLFEIYCLLALLKLLAANGYEVEGSDAIFHYDYGIEDDAQVEDKSLPNTFILSKHSQKVTLYYQPVISAVRFYNELKLFRTTVAYKLSDSDYYTPDFVLKFVNADGEENYIILDAKFSSRGTIIQRHLQEVIRKYSQETAVAHEVRAPKMVWVLQGRAASNAPVWRMAESPLAQQFAPATSYGIFTLNSLNESKQYLWDEIVKAIPWA